MRRSGALIIFARKPVPGRVKTRLSPPLTFEEGAELYSCMLLDTLVKVQLLEELTPVIFFQPDPGANEYFREIAPAIESFPQTGCNLGRRMANACTLMFARGYTRVAIIGSDSPDLPEQYILQAFSLMADERTDAVLGPAEDGGYYLLAMKRLLPELFENIPWSSPEVLQVSMARANAAEISIALLPDWHDVDSFADLARAELLDESNGAQLTRGYIAEKIRGKMA